MLRLCHSKLLGLTTCIEIDKYRTKKVLMSSALSISLLETMSLLQLNPNIYSIVKLTDITLENVNVEVADGLF